jgi:hypothetical protein
MAIGRRSKIYLQHFHKYRNHRFQKFQQFLTSCFWLILIQLFPVIWISICNRIRIRVHNLLRVQQYQYRLERLGYHILVQMKMLEIDHWPSSNGHGLLMVCKSNSDLMISILVKTTYINPWKLVINSTNNGIISTSLIVTPKRELLPPLNQALNLNGSWKNSTTVTITTSLTCQLLASS